MAGLTEKSNAFFFLLDCIGSINVGIYGKQYSVRIKEKVNTVNYL